MKSLLTPTPISLPWRSVVIALLLGCALLFGTTRSMAATLTVTNTNDSGAGSLRAAIAAANPGDTINFAVTGQITLTTGELLISKSLMIQGPGANVLAISGNNNSRVFSINDGTVMISGLTITGGNGVGVFPGLGGGIFNDNTSALTLANIAVIGNTAPNVGGGIYNRALNPASLSNSTVSGNRAPDGGGLFNFFSSITIVNSTFSGNTATTGTGGGIGNNASPFAFPPGVMTLTNSTVVNNTATTNGGGIYNQSFDGLRMQSTIVAKNTAPASPDIIGPITSQGYNLIGNPTGAVITGVTTGNILNVDPLVGPLANNGGPTQTHALLPGSPALDKGIGNNLATDQRGLARIVDLPSVVNATDGTDIGAFEFNDIVPRVSDTKAGSVLVFPFYTSTIGGASDTRITISSLASATQQLEQVVDPGATLTYVHLFLIDGATCQQADFYLCLTPNASFSFKASEYDPGNTGYVLAVAVNAQGVPVRNNVLIGNAFVNTPDFADNYGAEAFWANTTAVAAVNGNTATLFFDNNGYDAVPNQFAVEIQSPVDVVGQQIVTAGLSGSLVTSTMSGAAQVGTGLVFNEKEVFGSFTNWLTGTCQARATISTTSPRVPNGLGNLIKTGQAGMLKFNVGAAVGLILTPRTATWRGIRTLHKTQTTATAITIPILVPVC